MPLLVSEEDEIRQSATEIIRKIGKPAVEPLATALAEADDRLKTRIMKVLDRMGYKPKAKQGTGAEVAPPDANRHRPRPRQAAVLWWVDRLRRGGTRCPRHPVGVVDIAQIKQQPLPHGFFEPVEIEISELVPLGHDDRVRRHFQPHRRLLCMESFPG